jgi:hypothetical protein
MPPSIAIVMLAGAFNNIFNYSVSKRSANKSQVLPIAKNLLLDRVQNINLGKEKW